MPTKQPDLIHSYVEYVQFRNQSIGTGVVNLKSRKWLNSTTVLLLAFLKSESGCQLVSNGDSDAKSYLDQMVADPKWWREKRKLQLNSRSSYIPFSELPEDEEDFKALFTRATELIKSYKSVGGESAFKHALSELTDNIYQHSQFEKSFMMCQAYEKKGYVELSFIDDGISIPGNFEDHDIKFDEDAIAISLAVDGQSTKDLVERGTGLGSSLRIYCEGAGAEAMIVSRKGAYYRKLQESTLYHLNDEQKFHGTLISIRIPVLQADIEYTKYIG